MEKYKIGNKMGNTFFEGAEFGDKFEMRNHETAIYIGKVDVYEPLAMREYPYISLILKDGNFIQVLEENGLHPINDDFDIIGKL